MVLIFRDKLWKQLTRVGANLASSELLELVKKFQPVHSNSLLDVSGKVQPSVDGRATTLFLDLLKNICPRRSSSMNLFPTDTTVLMI